MYSTDGISNTMIPRAAIHPMRLISAKKRENEQYMLDSGRTPGREWTRSFANLY